MSTRTRFLDATTKGDLKPAEKQGGEGKPGARAQLPPAGVYVAVRDALERKAVYAHVQEVRLTLAGALSEAAVALRGLIEVPASVHDAIGMLTIDDLPLPTPGDLPAVAMAKQVAAITDAARGCLPDAKIMEQRRRAIAMLFSLAKTLKFIPRPKAIERKTRKQSDKPSPPSKV